MARLRACRSLGFVQGPDLAAAADLVADRVRRVVDGDLLAVHVHLDLAIPEGDDEAFRLERPLLRPGGKDLTVDHGVLAGVDQAHPDVGSRRQAHGGAVGRGLLSYLAVATGLALVRGGPRLLAAAIAAAPRQPD